MKRIFTSLLTIAMVASTAHAAVTALEPTGNYLATVPTSGACFGYSAATINENTFAVSASAKLAQENSRFVNIYRRESDNTATLIQTVSEPSEGAGFYGYLLEATENILAVYSSIAKTVYFYEITDGVVNDEVKMTLTMSNIPTSMSMTDDVFVATNSSKTTIDIYDLDMEAGTITSVFTDATRKYCSVRIEGDVIAASINTSNVVIFERTNGEWAETQEIEIEHGNKNYSRCIDIKNGAIFMGGLKTTYVIERDDSDTFAVSQSLDIPEELPDSTDEGDFYMWGYSICANDDYLVTCSRYNDTTQLLVQYHAYVYKKGETQWELAAGLQPETNGKPDRNMSSCILGDMFVYTNQVSTYNGETNVGRFFTYDLSQIDETDADSSISFANANVRAGQGGIVVNTDVRQTVTVYNILGQIVTQIVCDGEQRISVPSGLYLVNLSGTTQKVLVK